MRAVMSVVLILLGLMVAAYGGIGSLFVWGGVESGDSSVGWISVVFMFLLTLSGVAMFVRGLWLLLRESPKDPRKES